MAKWNAAGVLLWVQTYPARLGTAWNATAADVVCASVRDALDLLLDPMALAATLRP